ncbi:MAG: hypothetical protein CL572_05785 [Alphaproteobacteria bacterium]|nr:hypothetical protein [Alphaproteobacteria bacterium]
MDFLKDKKLIFRRTLNFNCSYKSGRKEKRLYINLLNSDKTNSLISDLTKNGFRRSFDHMYIPICEACNLCIPSRINLEKFKLSKSNKRNMKINRDLELIPASKSFNNERYKLFKEYCSKRHAESKMGDMSLREFNSFFYDHKNKTEIFDLIDSSKKLYGSILLDVLNNGYSAVYSFFNANLYKRGLGKNLIIQTILKLKNKNISHLYLGYWVKDSDKMNYKILFNNIELFKNGEWVKKY